MHGQRGNPLVAAKAFLKFQAEINEHYDILRDVVNKLGVAGTYLWSSGTR